MPGDTRTVRVRCVFELDVEVPADMDADVVEFLIEENNCPGSGPVGSALEAAMERAEREGTCWCCPTGSCEIVDWFDV